MLVSLSPGYDMNIKENLTDCPCVCWLVSVAPDENHEGITVACGSRAPRCWSFQSNLERGLYSYHSLHYSGGRRRNISPCVSRV